MSDDFRERVKREFNKIVELEKARNTTWAEALNTMLTLLNNEQHGELRMMLASLLMHYKNKE